MGTAYYLGDDIKQILIRRVSFLTQRTRSACVGLHNPVAVYGNENYEGFDPHLSEVWSARFEYTVPLNVVAKPELIDRVLDDYQKQCNAMVLADKDAFDVSLPAKLWMDEGNFYDILIDKSGKLATVFYGAVGVVNMAMHGVALVGAGISYL